MFNILSFLKHPFLVDFSIEKNYFLLLFIHVIFGCAIYFLPGLGYMYGTSILVVGLFYIILTKNKNNEILQVAAYTIGSEVLLRMTDGVLSFEFAKYSLILFALLGSFYSGFSKKSILYLVYILLLIPSIILENDLLRMTRSSYNQIVFNLLGPITLGIISIYTFNKKIPFTQLNGILLSIGFPILICSIYVFLYSPEISIITSVESNSSFSGGFGPNQVATALGIGMFVFFFRFLLLSKTRIHFVINLLIFSFISYVGLLTFSRGGIITGFVACIALLLFVYINSKDYGKRKAKYGFIYLITVFIAILSLINFQTNGLIEKRYSNKDHLGRLKRDKSMDRKELAKEEINLFVKNPIVGVGVGNGNQIREIKLGSKVNSHDELTRLLAEHGLFGFLCILILVLTPVFLFIKSKENIFLGVFFLIWFLTINHSGLRIAAPAFIYSLMLLKISIKEEYFFVK